MMCSGMCKDVICVSNVCGLMLVNDDLGCSVLMLVSECGCLLLIFCDGIVM